MRSAKNATSADPPTPPKNPTHTHWVRLASPRVTAIRMPRMSAISKTSRKMIRAMANMSKDLGLFGQNFQEGVNHIGAELCAAVLDQLLNGRFAGHGLAVRAGGRHGVVTVGNGDDGGQKRDLLAHQAVGITLTVKTFVMVADDGQHGLVLQNGLEDLLAQHRVQFNGPPLFLVELPRVV